ncbi:MAG: S16 family serine protease [Bacilli bacterium]
MINKIYAKTKQFIKENIIIILIYIFILVISTVKLPYIILTGGGIIDTTNRIDIENKYKSKGSLNLAYVREIKATIPTYIIGKFNSNWETIKKENIILNKNETINDTYVRDKLYLDYGNETAIKTAYALAHKEFLVNYKNIFVVYIDELSKTNLKIGDIILTADKNKIFTSLDFKKIIEGKQLGEVIDLTVKRGDKIINCNMKIVKIKEEIRSGIAILETSNYKTNPPITLKFNSAETGPSGGLMMTLAIYDMLTKEDLTKGYKIVGTGTIEEDGTIGEIGGIRYKLAGAIKEKADIFIAPSGNNYKEVIKIKQKKNLKIKIIEAKNIVDVITQLNNL